ncbi:MAG: hypothetical protein Q9167_007946 [Letrouitia subvulpina]
MVLSGLGGIGKTQLSIEFVRRHQLQFSAVIWLDGSSEDRLKQSIVAAAGRIPEGQIPESSRMHLLRNTSDSETVIKDVLGWFSIPENQKWLIVFDNIDQDYGDMETDSQESKKLLGLLDGLPLALAQASVFMRQTKTSFVDYLEFYKK